MLILVLAFVVAVGAITIALLSQTHANLVVTGVVQSKTQRFYTANAGIDFAIDTLRNNSAVCGGGVESNDFSAFTMPQLNSRDATISCGLNPSGSGGWDIFAVSPISGIPATPPGAQIHNAGGPPGVYPVPVELLAALPAPTATPPVAGTIEGSCVVFSPGSYSAPPTLSTTAINYFASGVYYLQDVNWTIGTASVLAGEPSNGATRQLGQSCTGSATFDANRDNDDGGAVFVLGGSSTISIGAGARIEVFAHSSSSGLPGVSIHQADGSVGWAAASTVLAGTQDILAVHTVNFSDSAVIHGQVYAPLGQVSLDRLSFNGQLHLRGGIVIDTLAISGTTAPQVSSMRGINVVATAESVAPELSASTTANATVVVSSDPTISPHIASWRLS